MKIRATIATGVTLYDLVFFDEVTNEWVKATSHEGLIGCIIGLDEGSTEAIIDLNGELQAYTSRVISPHGGSLNVENGRVFVDNNTGSSHRFILPYSGDLNSDGNIPSGSIVNIII